jgi:hypothetical protein
MVDRGDFFGGLTTVSLAGLLQIVAGKLRLVRHILELTFPIVSAGRCCWWS